MVKDFSFVKVRTKSSLGTCLDRIIEIIGIEFRDKVYSIRTGNHEFAACLLLVSPYIISGGDVRFMFTGIDDIYVKKNIIDVFCYFFKIGWKLDDYELFKELIDDGIGYDEYDFSQCEIHEISKENGQSKICLSTLLPLVNSGPEVHLLVIGSSSEDVDGTNFRSGRTYEMLIDFLPALGYYGSITLIDPYEISRKYTKDGFDIEFVRGKYDYNVKMFAPGGKEFTHVYDDVWMVTKSSIRSAPVEYDNYVLELSDVRDSKFAYTIRLSPSGKRTLYVKNGLVNHVDLEGAIAGGYMIYDKRTIRKGKSFIKLYGSSNRLSHYDKNVMIQCLTDYNVVIDDSLNTGRLTWDPGSMLFKNYKDSVISCKHFGEDIQIDSEILDQVWYNGVEKRLLYGKKIKHLKGNYGGCGCSRCLQYSVILTHLVNYRNGSKQEVYNMLNSVISDNCIARHGSLFLKICNHLKASAHAKGNGSKTLEYICSKYHCTREQVLRVAHFLRKKGDIDYNVCTDISSMGYNILIKDNGKDKYYSKFGKDYYVVSGDKIYHYDKCDNVIIDNLHYRPINSGDTIDEAVKYFHLHYRDLFNVIDGYEHLECTGNASCGFSDEYEFVISRFSTGIVLDSFQDWYLSLSIIK